MKDFCKSRFVLIGGGFLVGILVGYLIFGLDFEISIKKSNGKINNPENIETALVSKIIDGDSLELATGEQVRLLGIDTKEYGEECFDEAKVYLTKLLENKEVKLASGSEDKDKYDRLLRWVWLGDENINIKLVEEGLATAYIYGDDLEYEDSLIDAEASARDENTGCLWSRDMIENDLPEIDYTKAPDRVGQELSVKGVIDNIFVSAKGNMFINFCSDYKTCAFTGVIFKTDQHRFENLPDQAWLLQEVLITGEIEKYQGRAEIIISSPEQIELVN